MNQAIERVELLAREDPVPGLLERIEASAQGAWIDDWALRHLARRADVRAVDCLARLFRENDRPERSRELLAAALLACGADGRVALSRVLGASDADANAREVAQIALSLAETRHAGDAITARVADGTPPGR